MKLKTTLAVALSLCLSVAAFGQAIYRNPYTTNSAPALSPEGTNAAIAITQAGTAAAIAALNSPLTNNDSRQITFRQWLRVTNAAYPASYHKFDGTGGGLMVGGDTVGSLGITIGTGIDNDGDSSLSIGMRNIGIAEWSTVGGIDNSIGFDDGGDTPGVSNVIWGAKNTIDDPISDGIAVGNRNTLTASNAAAIGHGLSNSSVGTMKLGMSEAGSVTIDASGNIIAGLGTTNLSGEIPAANFPTNVPYVADVSDYLTTLDAGDPFVAWDHNGLNWRTVRDGQSLTNLQAANLIGTVPGASLVNATNALGSAAWADAGDFDAAGTASNSTNVTALTAVLGGVFQPLEDQRLSTTDDVVFNGVSFVAGDAGALFTAEEAGLGLGYLANGSVVATVYDGSPGSYAASELGGYTGVGITTSEDCWAYSYGGGFALGVFSGTTNCYIWSQFGGIAGADLSGSIDSTVNSQFGSFIGADIGLADNVDLNGANGSILLGNFAAAKNISVESDVGVALLDASHKTNVAITLAHGAMVIGTPTNEFSADYDNEFAMLSSSGQVAHIDGDGNMTLSGSITADGSGLTALDATALLGEIPAANFTTNVPYIDDVSDQLGTADVGSRFAIWDTNGGNWRLTRNGQSLTNLQAANLIGTVPAASGLEFMRTNEPYLTYVRSSGNLNITNGSSYIIINSDGLGVEKTPSSTYPFAVGGNFYAGGNLWWGNNNFNTIGYSTSGDRKATFEVDVRGPAGTFEFATNVTSLGNLWVRLQTVSTNGFSSDGIHLLLPPTNWPSALSDVIVPTGTNGSAITTAWAAQSGSGGTTNVTNDGDIVALVDVTNAPIVSRSIDDASMTIKNGSDTIIQTDSDDGSLQLGGTGSTGKPLESNGSGQLTTLLSVPNGNVQLELNDATGLASLTAGAWGNLPVSTMTVTNTFFVTNWPPSSAGVADSVFLWHSNNHGIYVVNAAGGTTWTSTNKVVEW